MNPMGVTFELFMSKLAELIGHLEVHVFEYVMWLLIDWLKQCKIMNFLSIDQNHRSLQVIDIGNGLL